MQPARLTTAAALATALLVAHARGDDLKPAVFQPLPLGTVRPAGWLKAQIETQAAGLSGHLDEFWPDIKDSAWFGGTSEGWERVPYWLDGLVPLAYQLDDPALKAKVEKAIGYILDHQQPDGWLGPVGDTQKHKPYDVWPLFPLFKALLQYEEATGDPRVIPALVKCARKIDEVISKEPMYSWAQHRAADFAVCLYHLHDKTGGKEPWLIDLARKSFAQSHDWLKQYDPATYALKDRLTKDFDLTTHGVNTGMALKYGPVRWRLTGDDTDLRGADRMIALLDRYHGQATGIFTCDEHLAGRSPSQGTELCTVVESMYALELAAAITGDAALADRLERLAFNAQPATYKKDMTAHQYDQQNNQVACTREGEHVYATNGADSNLYGLEPNFGCCTANFHQGWPKFTSNLWMRSADGGLAAISYAPCVVETEIGGKAVRVEVKTDYPFRGEVEIALTVPEPMRFPVHLRLPRWNGRVEASFPGGRLVTETNRSDAGGSGASSLTVDDVGTTATISDGNFARIEGEWSGTQTFRLRIQGAPAAYRGAHGSLALTRGPLVFALPIEAEWKTVNDREGLPFDDYEVHPRSPWNFGLALDPADLAKSVTFEERPMPAGGTPFRQDAPPLVAKVKGRPLPGWTIEKAAAQPPPASPVASDEPERELSLIPYGATDLRVTEFPILRDAR